MLAAQTLDFYLGLSAHGLSGSGCTRAFLWVWLHINLSWGLAAHGPFLGSGCTWAFLWVPCLRLAGSHMRMLNLALQ
jgi:hypothetical protein